MTIPERSGDLRERVRRPEPIRTRPARGGWLDLFGAPGASPRSDSTPPDHDDAQSPGETPLTRAVELGYRVVDDYIRQGQNAARLVAQRAYGPQALQQDAQHLMTRMFEYTSEFSAMWFDFIGTAATGWPAAGVDRAASAPAPPPRAAAGDSTSSAATASEKYSTISVYVETDRPVTLRTGLRPIADGVSLRVQALRAASPDLPLLDDLAVSRAGAGAPVVVRIGIPRDHPPGTYGGVIVDDATNVPVGTIQVRIPD